MTSEAAGYFPEALARELEVSGPVESALAISPGLRDAGPQLEEAVRACANECGPVPELSDRLLLEKIQQGDKEALALLFRRHARAVRNVAFRILHNEAEADDVVQEVFLFIFRKASLFDGSQGAARSWIFQVAYHRAFDRRRYLHSRHFYTNQDLEEAARRPADPGRELSFHEVSMEGILGKRLAARFNARLTPEQQETILLFFFEGYALQEIAQLTGRSLVNVRQHYYRGLARLRKYILPEKLRSK